MKAIKSAPIPGKWLSGVIGLLDASGGNFQEEIHFCETIIRVTIKETVHISILNALLEWRNYFFFLHYTEQFDNMKVQSPKRSPNHQKIS